MSKKIGDFIDNAVHRMERRGSGDELPIPMPPQWGILRDELDGGWWPGNYIIVGNTGTGKTQFALQAALAAALAGVPSLYISLELDEMQITARLLGQLSGKPWSEMYLGRDHGAGLEHCRKKGYINDLRQLPISYVGPTTESWTYTNLLPQVKDVFDDAKNTPGDRLFVVLDFLQLVGYDKKFPNIQLRERIKETAYAGVAAANKYNSSIVMLSSTARENYGLLDDRNRNKKVKNNPNLRPGEGSAARLVGLGKESGDVEYAASNLIALCYADGEGFPDNKDRFYAALAKRRTGIPRWVELYFDGKAGGYSATGVVHEGIIRDTKKKQDD